jgi:hypothetical protein
MSNVDISSTQKSIWESCVTFSVVIGILCLTLFLSWETSSETWGYWYFARVFSETGAFIVSDRSPLFVLYLNLFSWLPYPTSVVIEYVISTGITLTALIILFRYYLGTLLAIFAACLWLPYLQAAEPPVQKMALACSIVAVLLRRNRLIESRFILSYTFLLLAYLFRQTYIIIFVMFLIYDIYCYSEKKGIINIYALRPKLINVWPIFLVFILIIWFVKSQSLSTWNNVYFTDTQWFPSDGKTMVGGAIQSMNWVYILIKYGTFEGHDFYFTNQEAFDGASNIISAAIINPQFFLDFLIYNLSNLIPTLMTGIWFPRTGINFIDNFILIIILFGVIYASFKRVSDSSLRIFILSSIFMAGMTVVALPKWRYMMPMIPIYILAASWYGMKIASFMSTLWSNSRSITIGTAKFFIFSGSLFGVFYIYTDHFSKPMRAAVLFAGFVLLLSFSGLMLLISRFGSEKIINKLGQYVLLFPSLAFIIIFSSAQLFDWIKIYHKMSDYVREDNYRLLKSDTTSMKDAYYDLSTVTKGCKGIMTFEPLFFGAFMALPLNKIYSPWEIPPFGKFGESVYSGLNPDRVDCVFISYDLANTVGAATNIQVRYENYIRPYVLQLQSLGAVTYSIPNFGQVVIISH